jgi:inosine/guanosine/xanthosine phosphorylase family protein
VTAAPSDDRAPEAAEKVRAATDVRPSVAVILGSGLGAAMDGMERSAEISYQDLPGFPPPSVPGHAGRLVVGAMAGVPVAAFLGRVHFYEGHPMEVVTLPARLAAQLGVRTLIATAAVGALDPDLAPGSLVIGSDHLNFLGQNPLRGWRDPDGRPPFVDMTTAYDPDLSERARAAAQGLGMDPARGVYAAMPGPTYETPAELTYLRKAGATVVGMSVVPEAAVAAALELRFVGLFCVTNVVGVPVDHHEVTDVAGTFAGQLGELLARLLPEI